MLAGRQQTESNSPRPTGIDSNSSNDPGMMSTTTGFVEFKCPPDEKGQDVLTLVRDLPKAERMGRCGTA